MDRIPSKRLWDLLLILYRNPFWVLRAAPSPAVVWSPDGRSLTLRSREPTLARPLLLLLDFLAPWSHGQMVDGVRCR